MASPKTDDPVIVFGAPRSGTTYLCQLLNSHPDVFVSNEVRLFSWLHRSHETLTRDDSALLGERVRFTEWLRHEYPALVRRFYDHLSPTTRYWGDKNPHYASRQNAGCLEYIANLFPGARFIHLIRDGRAVVSSLLRKLNSSGEPWAHFEAAIELWEEHVDIGCAFGQWVATERYFQIHYERLVADDQGTAEALFAFLTIPMHDRVLEFCRREQARRTPYSGPTRILHSDAAQSDWKIVLTPQQRLTCLSRLGRQLIHHGYESPRSLIAEFREAAEGQALELMEPRHAAIERSIPADATVLVVSKGDDELLSETGRTAWHFPQTPGGAYAGHHPADSDEAISHLERLRAKGGQYLLFPDTAYWWLEHYVGFRNHLGGHYQEICHDRHYIIYKL